MTSISNIIANLKEDSWRMKVGFSPEVESTNQSLFESGKSDQELAGHLGRWLQRHQPCLFGRIAAGPANLITYCILTEEDLARSDKQIRDKIQKYRLLWKREAFRGRRSAFVIVAISPRIASAPPNDTLKELAQRLCQLYLLEEIPEDSIRHDTLTLEVEAAKSEEEKDAWFEWRVGVNFFGAQGDGRWWRDHRIPGGIAFSMNSVGHMARSGSLQRMRQELKDDSGRVASIAGRIPIDSLGAALKFAMLTINNASETESGRATFLHTLDPDKLAALEPKCPFHPRPQQIERADHCTYSGWYNTDSTIPGDYFRLDVSRPADVSVKALDFRYLFDERVENPDFERMGKGVQIL